MSRPGVWALVVTSSCLPGSVAAGEPSFGLSTLSPDVLACAAPHVHERRPGLAWRGPEWPGRLDVCAVIDRFKPVGLA